MLKITKGEFNKIHNDYKNVLETDFIYENKNYNGSKTIMKWIEGIGTVLLIEGIGFELIDDDDVIIRLNNNEIKNGIIQFTKEQATKIYDSLEWKNFPTFELLKFQLFQQKLCVDINYFKSAMQKHLLLEPNPWNMDKDKLIHRYLNQMKFTKPTSEELLALLSDDILNQF